jgi:hypothetical protein
VTDHHRFNRREEAADRLLDEHQHALAAHLDTVLDVEAGLREVLLQSRHDALVDDLDIVLEVEAGLATILPAKAPPLLAEQSDSIAAPEDPTGVRQFLQSVSPQVRMALRRQPDVVAASDTLGIGCELDVVLARAHDLARDLARNLDRRPRALETAVSLADTLEQARALDSDLERAIPHLVRNTHHIDLHHAHAFVCRLVSDFDGPGNFDRYGVRRLARDLEDEGVRARAVVFRLVVEVGRVIGVGLGLDLPRFDGASVKAVLDDFTASDLRNADLTGIDLSGVRWSESGTQWPAALDVEHLKTRSDETPAGSGIYVVRWGTATLRDFAVQIGG